VSVDFSLPFLFTDVFYAGITLEKSLSVDLIIWQAVFITHAPAQHSPRICPVSKSDKFPTFRFFATDITEHNHYHTVTSTRGCEQTEELSLFPADILAV
jgi:hypothetical protein